MSLPRQLLFTVFYYNFECKQNINQSPEKESILRIGYENLVTTPPVQVSKVSGKRTVSEFKSI